MWTHAHNLLLASGSETRRLLLQTVPIPVDIVRSNVDERLVEKGLSSASSSALALGLAELKAKSVSVNYPDRVTLGSDQVLDFNGNIFHKQIDRDGLINQIFEMQGRSHLLHSAVSIVHDGVVMNSFYESALMSVRPMKSDAIARYVDATMENGILSSVGGYHFENAGAKLFTRVSGDYSTVLGLPLRSLISYFYRRGLFII